MTALARIAWTERSRSDDRTLLVIDPRPIAGFTVGTLLAAVPFLAAPLGRLASPFALLVVLPPLALTLEVFGWRDRLASSLARFKSPRSRLVATYAVWLLMSALLTLDVAAVAAASVGIAVAGKRSEERRWQLGGAILGANVGSLLLPFSNLTNLVLVSASGIGFATYVGLAVAPQVAAALAVGSTLAWRARRSIVGPLVADDGEAQTPPHIGSEPLSSVRSAHTAGVVAMAGAVGAVAVGLVGGDMAVPFALSCGLLAAVAVGSGRSAVREIVGTIPVRGLAIVMIAAAASGPIGFVSGQLPRPDSSVAGLVLALGVGGLIAAIANNLPAAVFGAAWLVGVPPATVIAFLIGTNVSAVATPHGSVATLLARAVGRRHDVVIANRAYLGTAWRYAVIGSLAAILALIAIAR